MADDKSRARYKKWYEENKDKAREMKRINMQKLRDKNPDKYNAQSRKAKIKDKLKLFLMYGNTCAICGFSDMRALSLDHVKNNGNEERRLHGIRGTYKLAKEKLDLEQYRILCMNCQFIERAKFSGHTDLNQSWQRQHSEFLQDRSNAA
jgi:hypothetical protein